MNCSPMPQMPQPHYVSNEKAADLAVRSPEKRVSQLFHNFEDECEIEGKRLPIMNEGL
jgi:hypothetical protein